MRRLMCSLLQHRRAFLMLLLAVLWPSMHVALSAPSDGTGFFWHITDMHWDASYNLSGPMGVSCGDPQASVPSGSVSGSYGSYLCDSPWMLINSSVQAMKLIKPDVDFLIWTGDDTPHNADISKDAVADIISNLTQQIIDAFPTTTVFPVLGNHDWSPKSQIPPRDDPFYHRIADIWKPWLSSSSSANTTFRRSGFYSIQLNENVTLVGLNTNLYYDNNDLTVAMPDPGNQFQWLDDALVEAAAKGVKVLLIGHVPPGQFEKHSSKFWFRPHYNQIFVELLRKHSRVFGSLHFGHHHTDSFRLFYDDKGATVGSFLIAPSVTPWETTLPGVMGGAGNNPGVRLVQYDRRSGRVLNVLQYYLNLTEANSISNGSAAQWTLAYNATEYYGLPDMTTESLKNLADRLWTDDGLFGRYYNVNGLYFDIHEKWSPELRIVHCCAITELDYKNYTTCKETHSVTSEAAGNLRLLPFTRFVDLNTLLFLLIVATATTLAW